MSIPDGEAKADRERLLAEVLLAIRAHQTAQDGFDEAACAVLGVNRSDGRCLDILDQHGRMTAGELARRADLSGAAITALLDRLERAGYVTRLRDSVDRRRVLVEVTPELRRRAWEIWGPMVEDGTGGLDRYSDDQLRLIHEFVTQSQEYLGRHLERLKALPRRGPAAGAPDASDDPAGGPSA